MSIQGDDNSGLGFGVKGTSTASTGVVGESNTANGVVGQSDAGNGVLGQSNTGDGVAGSSGQGNGVTGQSKDANGVLGSTNAQTGSGVFGSNKSEGNGVTGISEFGFGVFGQANQRNPDRLVAGIVGECKGPGWGVLGLSPEGRAAVAGLSDKGDGVLGRTSSDESAGVHGVNQASGLGHARPGVGVQGEGMIGVFGITSVDIIGTAGVLGRHTGLSGNGVVGIAPFGVGVIGLSGQISPISVGVTHAGIVGISDSFAGVYGEGRGSTTGVFAEGMPALKTFGDIVIRNGSADFDGDVHITGTLTKGNNQFQIDHPLDPANKYLNHASVESSEMKTIYDGIVVLDDQGQAVVELPDWFESLNTGFRYQLTPIGAPSLNLHIAEEISDNRFKIAGGQAGLKVCWQVTGIRHDAFVRERPLVVEMEKPTKEKGYFLHPEYHNQPKERGIAWARDPDMMRRFEQLHTSSKD